MRLLPCWLTFAALRLELATEAPSHRERPEQKQNPQRENGDADIADSGG